MSGREKGRPLNRKDKERLREKHRQELQLAKIEREKELARKQIRKLQQTGIVEAYQSFLRSICKYGLPQPTNVYEMAAQHVLKHQKKMRDKMDKKNMIYEYNSGMLKSSSPPVDRTPSPNRRKN